MTHRKGERMAAALLEKLTSDQLRILLALIQTLLSKKTRGAKGAKEAGGHKAKTTRHRKLSPGTHTVKVRDRSGKLHERKVKVDAKGRWKFQ